MCAWGPRSSATVRPRSTTSNSKKNIAPVTCHNLLKASRVRWRGRVNEWPLTASKPSPQKLTNGEISQGPSPTRVAPALRKYFLCSAAREKNTCSAGARSFATPKKTTYHSCPRDKLWGSNRRCRPCSSEAETLRRASPQAPQASWPKKTHLARNDEHKKPSALSSRTKHKHLELKAVLLGRVRKGVAGVVVVRDSLVSHVLGQALVVGARALQKIHGIKVRANVARVEEQAPVGTHTL